MEYNQSTQLQFLNTFYVISYSYLNFKGISRTFLLHYTYSILLFTKLTSYLTDDHFTYKTCDVIVKHDSLLQIKLQHYLM